ncbi:MFS transporter [Desulfitibacter alkalitolerans]|uniref:MFS transporter n=1 Tax=Desulfitibacter alkalitolerans TaxID=264641 RepID=UPI000489711D|nr:MFS transporter [Desulfitibacter alkalitolerans]
MHILKIVLISLGHMVTDISQGAIPLFLPYLKDAFDLSYFAVGLILLFSSISSSIIQPLFGFVSDRYQCLWMLPAGCFLAMTGVALIGFVPNYYLLLVVVTFSGLGVAAYHPEASKAVFYLSGSKKATAMSVFSLGGNFGFALGPIIAAFFLGVYGLQGSGGFLPLGLLMGGVLFVLLPKISLQVAENKEMHTNGKKNAAGARFIITLPIVLLMLIVTIRSWVHMGLMMNIPLYYIDYLQMDTAFGSSLLTIFLMLGAVGTLLGGPLADRLGLKAILYFSFISAVPLMYFLFNSSGIFTFIWTGLIGASIICTFSVTTVYAQKLMPENIGLASGLVLGFAIGTGGIGTTLLGLIADNFGLMMAINILIILPLIGVALIKLLPPPDEASEEA